MAVGYRISGFGALSWRVGALLHPSHLLFTPTSISNRNGAIGYKYIVLNSYMNNPTRRNLDSAADEYRPMCSFGCNLKRGDLRFKDSPTWLCYHPMFCEGKKLCRLAV